MEPNNTKIPFFGTSSERFSIATTFRENNFHHGWRNIMHTFRTSMQVSGDIGGRLSRSDRLRRPKQQQESQLDRLEISFASYKLCSQREASHGQRNTSIYRRRKICGASTFECSSDIHRSRTNAAINKGNNVMP